MPTASIIVRAKNEEALIGRALEMVAEQSFDDWEIVVVDSGSTDRTLEIARKYTHLIEEIPPEDFTYGYALNVGCLRASGKYAVLLSAHAVPCHKQWLRNLLLPFIQDEVAATWGSEHGWADSVETLPPSLSRSVTLTKDNYGPHNGWWGMSAANAAIRLDLWQEIRFDESIPISEDKLWAWNQISNGYKIVYVPEAAVYHTHQLSPLQVYRRALRENRAVGEFMPEIQFGFFDAARGVLKRPRRGLWKEAKQAGDHGLATSRCASYLGYRLACRVMYYWGLYCGLKDGRSERARGAAAE